MLEVVATIPFGELWTYGDVAGMAGSPRAARAAGSALAACPIELFVPCHRVVHAGGTIGGYGTPRRPQTLAPAARGLGAVSVRDDRSFDHRCERMMSMTRRLLPAVLGFTLLTVACTGNDGANPATTSSATEPTRDAASLSAQVASSDFAADFGGAGGVFSSTEEAGVQLLSFGEIDVAFSYLGSDGSQDPLEGPATTAGSSRLRATNRATATGRRSRTRPRSRAST